MYTIPDLTEIQTKSYARFLQYDSTSDKRKDEGLEGVLREIFPIESYDKKLSLVVSCATSWASRATRRMNAGSCV